MALSLGLAAQGQDLSVQAGATRTVDPRRTSYGWLLSYSHDLNPHLFGSFSYQNEGHVPSHHRDGHSAQLWARTSLISPQLSIAAGVGPYHYFDTTACRPPGVRKRARGSTSYA